MTRTDALALMHEYTPSDALRKHMVAVEAVMRAYARKHGEDEETWGVVGLLHDFDYERFPNPDHSPTDGHPAEGSRILEGRGYPEPLRRAILRHASYCGVPRDTPLAKVLFAVDELCGFLVACALVRPRPGGRLRPEIPPSPDTSATPEMTERPNLRVAGAGR